MPINKNTNKINKKQNNFQTLKNIFINETLKVEQDDVPKVLKELRNKYKNDINNLSYRNKMFLMEDDNWF